MINNKLLKSAADSGALVPSENFNTVLYTGNESTQSITNVGFQPDLVWFKNRAGISHAIVDSVRTRAKYIFPNDTAVEASSASDKDLVSFDTNGFTLGATSAAGSTNASSGTIVAWCWKAPDAFSQSASGNNPVASDGKTNSNAGFSIIKNTNPNIGSGTFTFHHGLSEKPDIWLTKNRNENASWLFHYYDGSTVYRLLFNTNDDRTDVSSSVSWDSTKVTLGASYGDGFNRINYFFQSKSEYSKIGTYTGNNSTSNFVNCSFEPAFLLVKRTDADANWRIVDNKRNTTNPRNSVLYPSLSNAEYTNAVENVNFTTTGFEIATTDVNWNASGGNYLFYAIAADPDTTTPTLAKSFNIDAYTGNGATQQIGSVNTLFTKYAVFNGGATRVDISQTLLGSGSTKIFSHSFWFRTSSATEQYFANTGASGSGSGFGFYLSPTTGYLNFQVANGSGTSPLMRNEIDYRDGKWHHVVGTYSSAGGTNDANMFLYVDGQNVTDLCTAINGWSQGGGATWSSFTYPRISLGNWADSSSYPSGLYPLIGSLDQVRFFNTALTQSQVTELYNETATTASTLNYPTGAGCLALYEFNDNADDTGNNYDGTNASGLTYDSFLFKPDLVITKGRDTAGKEWGLFDTQRGVKRLIRSNNTAAEVDYTGVTEFNNAGFTVANGGDVNSSGEDYISYSFKMFDNNNNVPVENTVGTIKSLTSVNAEAGMSITKYIGNGTQNATIGHGLTSAPDMVVIKNLDQNDSWFVSHVGLDSNQFVEFNTTAVAGTNADLNHERLSTTFKTTSASPHHMINTSGENYIMYSFHSVSGFSKFGTYTWTATNYTAGAMVSDLGFTPDFVMIKGKNEDSNFSVYDSERGATSGTNQRYRLALNDSAAETTSGYQGIGFDNNGFSAIVGADGNTTGSGGLNKQNGVYIYWAMKIN